MQIAQSKKYDYQRAKQEDPEVIQEHFRLLKNVVNKHGIQNDDIYNMDEIGFQKGDIGSAKVVTACDGTKYHIQPGDRDWVTVIECINSAKRRIPAMVIYKGKVFQNIWFDADSGVPKDWTVAISETGWTNNQLGLIWLKDVFEPNTRNTTGAKRLLIMDGHSSHCTEPFERYAREHNIILLWLPSHSSHILQPLDVVVFSSVKRRFRDGVQDLIRNGQNHVTNDDFLRIYAKLQPAALSNNNIESAFRATGILPFNPEEVLAKLGEFNLSTPPPVLLSSSVNSVSNTPRTVRQVEEQQTAVKLRQHQLNRQSTSPTIERMVKLVKTAKTALQRVSILSEQIKGLQANNAKQVKKRNIKVKYITQRESLTVSEAIGLSQRLQGATPKASISVIRHCSSCGSPEHNRRTCPALK